MNHQEALTSYVAAFVGELAQRGLKHVVISPGSRSTPMAMIMAEHPNLKIRMHVDERSAAFFALGMAKALQEPVVLLCTSGTAAANYYPAIIEAKYSRVPLIVLTADRPHELRDTGAPQTIDQIHLYGKMVKWFVEMAPPEQSETMLRYARTMAARATATATEVPFGPVHLNFPFREPLVPNIAKADLFKVNERVDRYVNVRAGKRVLASEEYEQIAQMLNTSKRGLIVGGPLEVENFAIPVLSLAKKLQYPILADPLSQLRSSGHEWIALIDTYDTILKNEEAKAALKPDVIIRFGSMPVSKPLAIFLKENRDIPQLVIDGGGGWRDPEMHAADIIYCDETTLCEELLPLIKKNEDNDYLTLWSNLNVLVRERLADVLAGKELSEGKVFALLHKLLPDGATLFVGNSMPIRDLDTFFHQTNRKIKLMGNRGANGIDGIVSTALGAGTVSQPLYLVVGDLTFFHDLNGLIASKLYEIKMTVIVINNNGGGIFSFLPQASHPQQFEKLFGTALNLNFGHAVKMYDGQYELISDWDHFREAFEKSQTTKGLHVLEVTTDRTENVNEHRHLWTSVSREISRFLKG